MPGLLELAPKKTREVDEELAILSLPPRPHLWPKRVLITSAFGAIAAGATILIDNPAATVGVISFTVLIDAALVTYAVRRRQRGTSIDRMIESVNPILGASAPTRDLVQPSRWTREWVGIPQRIAMRYNAAVSDSDPKFTEKLVTMVSRRLGVEYRVRKNSPRACVIHLEVAPPEERIEKTPAAERAEKVTQQLLGADSKAALEVDDDGAVRAINVTHNMGARISLSGFRARIEKAIDTQLPGRWRARWNLENDSVRFEIRPAMPSIITNELPGDPPELTHKSYMDCKFPYATDEDGNVLYWHPSRDAHMLVVGGTGSGKTSAEHTLLTIGAWFGWKTWVVDGKRIEFVGFRDYPNVEMVASKVEDQVRMIHAAHELMEERYDLIEAGEAKVSDFEALLLVIDEYATFKKRVERWYRTAGIKTRGMANQPPVFELIADIARLGRSAKVHMVLGIQRPDVTFVDGEMRDNFGARLSLGRLSPQGANMMWDSFAVGVVRKPRGQGVALDEGGNPVEVLVHYTPDPNKLDADDSQGWAQLRALYPPQVNYTRKRILTPTSSYTDLDAEEPTPPSYNDYAEAPIVDNVEPLASKHTDDTQPTPSGAPETPRVVRFEQSDDEPNDDDSAAEEDPFEGYLEPDQVSASSLSIGDLVLADESLNVWGVVEAVEPDLIDPDLVAIDFRDVETGEPNTVSVDEGETVLVRRPDPKA